MSTRRQDEANMEARRERGLAHARRAIAYMQTPEGKAAQARATVEYAKSAMSKMDIGSSVTQRNAPTMFGFKGNGHPNGPNGKR